MNQQEIFDKVVKHARTQMMRAVDFVPGGTFKFGCVYRTKEGCKCFMGCLIPDDMYSPSMEGFGIGNLFMKPIRELLEVNSEEDIYFLFRLQIIHDRYQPEYWEERFKEFATDHALVYNIETK